MTRTSPPIGPFADADCADLQSLDFLKGCQELEGFGFFWHSDVTALVQLAADGDQRAITELFQRYRPQLKRMIRLRMNRRLNGRVDNSNILQDGL